MSKKNKKKKINKIMKEVERKREVGFNSLIGNDYLPPRFGGVAECVFSDTEKAFRSYIDQWKNNNVRILLTTFFKDYMKKDYVITYYRSSFFTENGIEVSSKFNLINNKNKDERVGLYIGITESDKEDKEKGKFTLMVDHTVTYRDPKTKDLMETLTRGTIYADEL